MKNQNRLTLVILFSLVLGLVGGLALNLTGNADYANWSKPLGVIFLKLLKMIIVPLVFSSIYLSIARLKSITEVGKLGIKTLSYYMLTTAMAVILGMILVNTIKPGVGFENTTVELPDSIKEKVSGESGPLQSMIDLGTSVIPDNIVVSFHDGMVLQIIFVAIFFGLISLKLKDNVFSFTQLMNSVESLVMKGTEIIMLLAPIGVFALTFQVMAHSGLAALSMLLKYMCTVSVGLFVHFCLLTIIGSLLAKKSPLAIVKGLSLPLLTALSTASSAATLPITVNALRNNFKTHPRVTDFVVPLGATINMDGTALYESVAAIFIAQVYGIHLGLTQQVVIFVTATLAAVGAAAIPGAGLITMSIVLKAVGLPIEGIGHILAVDRILDMFRTTVNVYGDCVGALVVDNMTSIDD